MKTQVILAAGFGGVAPNLLKIALLLTAGPVASPDVAFILTYSFGLVILAILGIVTAWALKETDIKKALFIGMGLPAFFQVSAANISQIYATKSNVTKTEKTAFISPSLFSGVAFAEPPRPIKTLTVKNLTIQITGNKIPESIVFFSADRKSSQVVPISSTDTVKNVEIPISANTQSFTVNYQGVASQEVGIDSLAAKPVVSVKIEENNWSGFFRAIGFQNAQPYKITVTETKDKEGIK